METRILDGKEIGRQIREEVAAEIQQHGLSPGLTAVLVGDDPASKVYVSSKARASKELGIRSQTLNLSAQTTTEELLDLVHKLNQDDSVDGILVQLPLPKGVDGFHPVNVGRLCQGDFNLAPCTPMGIMEMLRREKVPLKGAEAVVVGRSDIVGKPMAFLLLHQHATVTICHSRTRDLPAVCRRADLLIAAVGWPALVSRDYIKQGAVVIDVGINRLTDREKVVELFGEGSPRVARFDQKGASLVGDVHPRDPYGIASAVTPVPGGVGPLTIAHLMKNTLLAHRQRMAAAA